VPRGSVTRQKLRSPLVGCVSKETQPRERPDRVADPDGQRAEREGASGQSETKRTVHAAWWSGPRLEGFDLRLHARSRADAGGHRSAGRARERRSTRGTPTRSESEGDNTSAPSAGSPKWESRRESASPCIVWEQTMRRAPRREAIVFEKRIRELQTSVERTGVAIGPHPRAPGSPNVNVGRHLGRNPAGEGT
jgi:hypothetical protein